MNLAAQLRDKQAADLWSNVHQSQISSTAKKRLSVSQFANDVGTERDLTLAPTKVLRPSSRIPVTNSAPPPKSHTSSSAINFDTTKKLAPYRISLVDTSEEYSDIEFGSNPPGPAAVCYKNEPHPSLECPPLYFVLKRFPYLLERVKTLYRLRWDVSYPFQKRVFFSKSLRKLDIHMTWGELLFLLPFFGFLIAGTFYTFAFPSVSRTGTFSRLPLLFALVTAVRNSIVTVLIGIPFDRTLWYHKLAGRIAFINGLLHTYIAYRKPVYDFHNFGDFAFGNVINMSGTFILTLIVGVLVTSVPYVRRKFFEVFYYAHIVFVSMMAVCAFYHSGIVVPVVAGAFWGTDLLFRKLIMPCIWYPQKATIRVISDTVVEISFPKTKNFNYNPGQFAYIAVPKLSNFEWHPFSLSSCPMQKTVTFHIRKAGRWTSALHALAQKEGEVSIYVEGPYGSPSIDITSNRYKSVLLFSGGIGITPMQSISNQLVYEFNENKRELKRLRLVWVERDPVLMEDVDVVRRSSHLKDFSKTRMQHDIVSDADSVGVASALLSMFPMNQTPDFQLEMDYPEDENHLSTETFKRTNSGNNLKNRVPSLYADDKSTATGNSTVVGKAYKNTSLSAIIDLQVYLTSNDKNEEFADIPFVRMGRPNIKRIFKEMREEALSQGEKRVAVVVCAPPKIEQICRNSCVKFSDDKLRFDFHVEY